MRNFLEFIKGKYRKKSKNFMIRNFTIIFLKIKNFLNWIKNYDLKISKLYIKNLFRKFGIIKVYPLIKLS